MAGLLDVRKVRDGESEEKAEIHEAVSVLEQAGWLREQAPENANGQDG
jgi:hypothetical protein